jgi:hypothetical protein
LPGGHTPSPCLAEPLEHRTFHSAGPCGSGLIPISSAAEHRSCHRAAHHQQQQQLLSRPPASSSPFKPHSYPQQQEQVPHTNLPWPDCFCRNKVSLPPLAHAPAPPSAFTLQQPSFSTRLARQRTHLSTTRGVKTLIPYAHAPKPLPRMRRPEKGGKLHRIVIRVPPQVEVTLKGQHLELSGMCHEDS